MDVTKIFTVLCGFLLIVCLVLSITCLVVMRNAVEETSVWQGRAEALVNELNGCVQAMKGMEADDVPVIAPDSNENEAEKKRYCLRLEGEVLAIYDADGYLIKRSETNASLLPKTEQEKLTAGIWAESWAAAGRLLQDYE